jgi:hypothetical protein
LSLYTKSFSIVQERLKMRHRFAGSVQPVLGREGEAPTALLVGYPQEWVRRRESR